MKAYGGWLRLASHLHMPLSECMKRTTGREYLVWNQWLDNQWNEPSRSDKYIMSLSLQVANVLSKKFKGKIEDFKLDFKRDTGKPMTKEGKEQAAKLSKATWIGAVRAKKNG